MSHAAVLAQIQTLVESVTDVGRVHNRPRYGDAYDHWVTEDVSDQAEIRAWEILIVEPGEQNERLQQNHLHRYRNWQVRGWVGIDDANASYNTMIALAEGIRDAIDADRNLSGTVLDITTPVQIDAPTFITIGGGFLCWAITLTFVTLEIVSAP